MARRKTIDEHLVDIIRESLQEARVDVAATLAAPTAPEELLPYIGWSAGLQYMLTTWPTTTQRSAVSNAVQLVRQRGTAGALTGAVEAMGGQLTLVEWWDDPDLGPGEWRAETTPGGVVGVDPVAQNDYAEAIHLVVPLTRHGRVGVVVTATADLLYASRARPLVRVAYT